MIKARTIRKLKKPKKTGSQKKAGKPKKIGKPKKKRRNPMISTDIYPVQAFWKSCRKVTGFSVQPTITT